SGLLPISQQSTDPYSNTAVQNTVSTMSNDIMDRIKSQYAGAGYSPTSSGDFSYQAGRGISAGIAPTLMQAQNDLTTQKMNAAQGLYGIGSGTTGLLSGLDQTALGNRMQGVDTANTAIQAQNAPYQQLLSIEAARRGIPMGNLSNLSSLIVPMAQLGTQQQGTSTMQGTQTMSPAQTAAMWAQALGGSKGGGLMGVAGQGLGLLGGFM
ncbi:MAG TPA: hypothetical protein VNM37_18850, partial [Candidatus Dormibacteraeota bacterium]|nr:hypothetical protein [Candidatus Dormibacteraeota bacterium]